jgi:hypothetical protein
MIQEKAGKHTMSKWLRVIYEESMEVYQDKARAVIAIVLTVSAVAYHYLLVFLPASLLAAEDYSVLAVWFILVPISGMILINHHFVMKPILTRKRMRNGKSGTMRNE